MVLDLFFYILSLQTQTLSFPPHHQSERWLEKRKLSTNILFKFNESFELYVKKLRENRGEKQVNFAQRSPRSQIPSVPLSQNVPNSTKSTFNYISG